MLLKLYLYTRVIGVIDIINKSAIVAILATRFLLEAKYKPLLTTIKNIPEKAKISARFAMPIGE